MINQPSYYAIIPASVRYDNTLPANAKLLYGEITALTSTEGYCWAGNKYFADLYGVDKDTVSGWISKLQKAGHVSVQVVPEANYQRRIFIVEKVGKKTDPLRQKSYPLPEKTEGGTIKDRGGYDKSSSPLRQKTDNINKESNTSIITNNEASTAAPFVAGAIASEESDKSIIAPLQKEKKAPPSGAPPTSEPPPPVKQDSAVSGQLRADCLAFNADNPGKYTPEMYKAFIAHWTAPVQNGLKKDIGKELWKTKPTWVLASRLATWHQNNQKYEQRDQTNGPKSAAFLNRQRIAEPAKNGYGKL